MKKIDDYTIQLIKDRAKIYDVVSDYVTLKKSGVRYTGLCPFHEDRNVGSFYVYPPRNVFKCFACDAKGGPVEFIMRHLNVDFADAIAILGRKYGIDTDTTPVAVTPPPPRPEPKVLPMLTLPMGMVANRSHLREDPLVLWIWRLPWTPSQRSRIVTVLRDYHVGHAKNGMTIWWQIDERQQVRTGKMMRYKADGHRDKGKGYNFDWIHSALSRRRNDTDPYPHPELFDPDRQECRPCYFGLHLIDRYRRAGHEQTVCIVESEKTAVLMAIAYGNDENQVWMACGGLENLSTEKLRPIIERGRRVVLYPDRDGLDKWRAKVRSIDYDRIDIDARPVVEWWTEADGPKADIADIVVRQLTAPRRQDGPQHISTVLADWIKENPHLQELIDAFDLKEID